MTLRADAAREETEETLGMLESRLDQAEHNIQLLQYAVHQHDERIAGLTYSPARNSVAVRFEPSACPFPVNSVDAGMPSICIIHVEAHCAAMAAQR